MIKLNRQAEALKNTISKIEQKIESLRDKYVSIEENVWNEHREMTEKERNKRYNIIEEIEELKNEINEIEFALDYLRNYVD